jgi:hypothetical protein
VCEGVHLGEHGESVRVSLGELKRAQESSRELKRESSRERAQEREKEREKESELKRERERIQTEWKRTSTTRPSQ